MDKKKLRSLSKGDVIRLLLVEHEARLILEKKYEELERRLLAYENAHTPSSKQRKNNSKPRDPDKERFPGKPKGSGGGGLELPPPDATVDHTLENDPSTGEPLGDPIGFRQKTVIDFPDKPIQVTLHRIWQYRTSTGQIIEAPVDLPLGFYGRNIQSIVVLLKNLTNSCGKIADFLRELGAPSFSTAQVQYIIDSYANALEPKQKELLAQIRKSSYAHSDETGMRQDGKNGYVWGVFTKTISLLFAGLSRSRKVIHEILGEFNGVLVTDGYVAYDDFPRRQRCWSHLLREFKEFAEDNPEINVQYTRLKVLYDELKLLKTKPPQEHEILKAQADLADIVTCLRVIKGAKKLVTLTENGGTDWFTALYYDDVPLDNNLAERGLRHIVLHRKVMGCYRNEKGKRFINIVISVLQTWKMQGKNLFHQLQLVRTT